ncbi:MAG: T9SS type A sorting domain-containing protein, partial [Bacteroidia bacterium]|nr:T9SS type A sorting domain-containing protein [Bacteroidia bacterium]
SNGCSAASSPVTVTVYPLPSANAGTDQSVCIGNSVTLTATGGVSYAWNNGIAQGVSFSPSTTSTYIVTVTDANGCTNSDNVIVTVNPLPTAEAGNNQTVCAGTSVTLTATGGSTYVWNNGVIQGISFTPTATNIYTVTATDSNGCSATDNVTVTVNPLPTAEAGNAQIVCIGTSVTLTATGGTTYLWNNGVTQGISFTPSATNTYTVTVTDANSCSATDNVTLTVNPLPPADAGTDQSICIGNGVTLTATGGVSYAWNNGISQGISFTPTVTNTYIVTVTDVNDCSNNDSVLVTVNSIPPTPTITLNGNIFTSSSTTDNQWYNQNGLIYGATSQTYTAIITGDYFVIVTQDSCISDTSNVIHFSATGIYEKLISESIKVYPNPANDKIEIDGLQAGKIELMNLQGQVIKKINVSSTKTRLDISKLSGGVYIMRIKTNDGIIMKKLVKE